MTRKVTDPDQLTDIQAGAARLADILLAGAPSPRKLPPDDVVNKWTTFGKIVTTIPSKKFLIAQGPNEALTAANNAITRMQLMNEGGTLIADMPPLLKRGSVLAKVNVKFMERSLFPSDDRGVRHESAAAFFAPGAPRAKSYDIFVEWVDDLQSNELPGSAGSYFLGVSGMADSVFHELLHIWFVHKFPNSGGDFGHTNPPTQNDAAFAKRMDQFQQQLKDYDSKLSGR